MVTMYRQLPIDGKIADFMENILIAGLLYVALGAAFFAHPVGRAEPDDFHWRNQIGVFLTSLPDVVGWPMALYRLARSAN